jgi:HAMP domain-containing protein
MNNERKLVVEVAHTPAEEVARRKFGWFYVAASLLIVIVSIVAVTSWVAHRRRRLRAAFDELPLGVPKSEVMRKLGKPWKVARCGETFRDGSPPGCAEEVIYPAPFATRVAQYWSFQFDVKGQLISKWQDLSP